jgi:hypothetical protein
MRLGRPMCRWEDNVPTNLTEIGWEDMGSYSTGEGQVVGSCEQGNETLASIKCGKFG